VGTTEVHHGKQTEAEGEGIDRSLIDVLGYLLYDAHTAGLRLAAAQHRLRTTHTHMHTAMRIDIRHTGYMENQL